MVSGHGREPVRRLAFAGDWYSNQPERVARDVDGWLAGVSPLAGTPLCLVAPHAGLRYSGSVAAWSYAPLRGLPLDAVVLIGPSHYVAFRGCAMLRRGSVETPWGALLVQKELAERLAGQTALLSEERRETHAREHSLELQLPLLARVQPDVAVIPILMGDQSRQVATALADALLTALAGRRFVVAASSDLSHYHRREKARRLDGRVLASLDALDPNGLMTALEDEPGHACGGGPVVTAMLVAEALGARGGVRRYADSGDVSGDTSHVVGYASAVWSAAA